MVRTVVDTELSEVLLKQIAELYLTVRGNAFASSCLVYKQASKQTLQKRKRGYEQNLHQANRFIDRDTISSA